MSWTYRVSDCETYAPLKLITWTDDPDDVAAECGEDYWDEHDGWEDSWPLDIEVFSDGVSHGVFTVEMEAVPSFSARRKEGTE